MSNRTPVAAWTAARHGWLEHLDAAGPAGVRHRPARSRAPFDCTQLGWTRCLELNESLSHKGREQLAHWRDSPARCDAAVLARTVFVLMSQREEIALAAHARGIQFQEDMRQWLEQLDVLIDQSQAAALLLERKALRTLKPTEGIIA